jgi:hypothetical protein
MTTEERLEIAVRIVADGGLAADLARALKLNGTRARRLHNKALQLVTVPPVVARPCTAQRHGTATAYRNWHCRCDTARQANNRYKKRRQAGIGDCGRVKTLGLIRRRQALAAMGYNWSELAAHYGRAVTVLRGHLERPTVQKATFQRWVRLYDALCTIPGPSSRARFYARRMGWAPPLAWDDIDNPRERPKGVHRREAA